MFHISPRWTLKMFCGTLCADGKRCGGVRPGFSARDSETHPGGGARSSPVVAGGFGAPGLRVARLAGCQRQAQNRELPTGAFALGAPWPDRFATRAAQCALWRSKFCSDAIERSFETGGDGPRGAGAEIDFGDLEESRARSAMEETGSDPSLSRIPPVVRRPNALPDRL